MKTQKSKRPGCLFWLVIFGIVILMTAGVYLSFKAEAEPDSWQGTVDTLTVSNRLPLTGQQSIDTTIKPDQ